MRSPDVRFTPESGAIVADVRFGSKADIDEREYHVRYVPSVDMRCGGFWVAFILPPPRPPPENVPSAVTSTITLRLATWMKGIVLLVIWAPLSRGRAGCGVVSAHSRVSGNPAWAILTARGAVKAATRIAGTTSPLQGKVKIKSAAGTAWLPAITMSFLGLNLCLTGPKSPLVNRVLTSTPLWYARSGAAGGPAVCDVQNDPRVCCSRFRWRKA